MQDVQSIGEVFNVKRMIVLMLAFALCGSAIAEGNAFGIDWTLYSEEQIKAVIVELNRAIDEANAELNHRNSGITVYRIGDIEFTVSFFGQNHKGVFGAERHVVCQIDWTNKSTQALPIQNNIIGYAYQHGKEIDANTYINDVIGGTRYNDRILPGESATYYMAFEIDDDSDVKIILSDIFTQRDVVKGKVFDIKISDLGQFRD